MHSRLRGWKPHALLRHHGSAIFVCRNHGGVDTVAAVRWWCGWLSRRPRQGDDDSVTRSSSAGRSSSSSSTGSSSSSCERMYSSHISTEPVQPVTKTLPVPPPTPRRRRNNRHTHRSSFSDQRWNENFTAYREFLQQHTNINSNSSTSTNTATNDVSRQLPRHLRDWFHRQKFVYRQRHFQAPEVLNRKEKEKEKKDAVTGQLREPHQTHRRSKTSRSASDHLYHQYRLNKLRSVGFHPNDTIRERSWDKMYQQLVAYLAQTNGVFPTSSRSSDDIHHHHGETNAEADRQRRRLHVWCMQQRRHRNRYQKQMENEDNEDDDNDRSIAPRKRPPTKSYPLTPVRIDQLNQISFAWSHHDTQWDKMYQELKTYHRHHGHCMVPSNYASNPTLAKWVDTQRQQQSLTSQNKINGGMMNDRRLSLLQQLDFVWNAYDYKWLVRCHELQAYQSINGPGMLPRHNDPAMKSLYRWVKSQQVAYRKCMLDEPSSSSSTRTAERRTRLERFGVL